VRVSKLKLAALIVMSVFGLWASSSVLVIFYTLHQQLPICPSGTFFGIHLDCSSVLTSPYSVVFGVPLEILALFYFAVNLGLVYLIAFGSERASRVSLQALFGWRFIGVAIVPYLVFVELFLIRAICVYCTIMHVAILTDFIVISYLLFFGKHSVWAEEEEMSLEEGNPSRVATPFEASLQFREQIRNLQ
jgi:uncharacterized membrane protein